MNKAFGIAGANLRRFLRDRSNAFFVFVLPLGIVLLIGAQFGSGFAPTIGIVGPDGDTANRIVAALELREDIDVVVHDDEDAMLLAVERGKLSAGVVIPDSIEASVAAGEHVDVGFMSRNDGLGPQMATIVGQAVSEASEPIDVARFVEALGVSPDDAAIATMQAAVGIPNVDVTVETAGELLFEGNVGQFDLGASTQLVLFMFLTGLAGSAAVIQTRNLGVARRMMGTPTNVGTIVAGEALGRFAIVLVQGLYIVAATVLIFQVNWGNPVAATALIVVFGLVGAAAALLFGTLFSSDEQAGSAGVVAGLGLAALGGSMLPVELFSDTLRTVSRFTPHSWANEAFSELVRRDGTLIDILPQLGVLLGFAALLFVLATWRMRAVITRV